MDMVWNGSTMLILLSLLSHADGSRPIGQRGQHPPLSAKDRSTDLLLVGGQ